MKYRDTLTFLMAGRDLPYKVAHYPGTADYKEEGALKSCHPEFHRIL